MAPRRAHGSFFPSLMMDEMPGSPQGSESYLEKHPGKTAKQVFLCKEGDQSFHQRTFQEIIDNCQTGNAGTNQENAPSQGSSLSKDHEMHWKEDLHECLYCGKVCRNTSYLIVHLRTQEGCRQRFSHLLGSKKTHVRKGHYDCSECGKCFSSSSSLRKHQKKHSGEKLYSCSQCGKCFSQRYVLWKHKKTHAGEKLHACSDCGKGFHCKSSLSAHQRAHTGEKTL